MQAAVAQIVWQAPRLMPLSLVVAALTLVAVVVFYIPQSRRLRHPWRFGLPLLRMMVGLALAASLVQPAIVHSEAEDERGAVVVLVDGSRSMSVTDRRSPAQQVALADALRMLPTGVRSHAAPGADEEIDALVQRVDQMIAARADAEYARLSGQGVIAAQSRYDEIARQVSASATELARRGQAMPQASDLAKKLAGLASDVSATAEYRSRIQAARTALSAAQAAADVALYARPDVKTVCDEVASLSRAQLAERAMSRARGDVLASLRASGLYGYAFSDSLQPLPGTAAASRPAIEPVGLSSDIAGAVRAATERMKGRLLQAIVVLTDGRQVGGEGGVASSLSATGVPVYAVSVGTPAPRDLSVVDVALPQRQFTGETTIVRVQLRRSGMKGVPVEVTLNAAGRSQSQTVTLEDITAMVEFPLKFDTPGTHEVIVTALAQDGETTAANNEVRRRVIATADRAAVALVGASASWDFQLLRKALSQAPWATVEAEVLDAPGAQWTISPSEMTDRSLIVLCDVTTAHLSSRQWDALYRFVTERGGSVLVIAGQNTSSPQFIDSPLLTDLLPFRAGARPAWRTWSGENPLFRLQPAPGASDLDALKLSDDAAPIAERWLELPAVFQYLPVAELKPNTTPLLVERESSLPVLTDSRLGLGRVLFFGFGETWRWRQGGNRDAHERFWLQLFRHAVDQPYAVRNGPLRLDADRPVVRPRQPVEVRAKVENSGSATTGSMLPLTVMRDGAQIGEVPLSRDPAAAGRYTGVVQNLVAGSYVLRLGHPSDGSITALLPIYVQADEESEMRDVSGDDRTLRRLAESTGGELLTLSEWDTLPRRLREANRTNRQAAEQRLWDSPQLFAFVLGCLGIEWAMRKRLGLA